MDATHLELRIELELEGDSLRGRLVENNGAAHDFSGRLGLLSLVDAIAERALGRGAVPSDGVAPGP
jgi:hypothetical protein